jgi:CRP/FNR family transcriptional regulator, cyclic AMP receptor protein
VTAVIEAYSLAGYNPTIAEIPDWEGMTPMDNLNLLRGVPMFARLSDEHLRLLSSSLGSQTFGRGATIFHRGSVGDTLYLIVHGQVRIYTVSQLGQELSVTLFRDGNFFGELSLLDGHERSASAVAMRATTTLTLHRAAFMQAIRTYPEIAISVLEELSARLRHTNTYIEHLASTSAPQRVIRTLLDLADQHGEVEPGTTRVDLHLTQDDLASLAGTTRETVNRVLSGLRDQGLIRIERARLSVLNLTQLELLNIEC